MASLLLAVTLIILIAMRTPISIAMGIAAIVGFCVGGYHLYLLSQSLINGALNPAFIAVFFFILAGNLMNEGGLTERLFRFARAFVGRMTGGLVYVNILNSMLFAGISGSAAADVAGPGVVELKAMRDEGYDLKLSVGITIASAVVGPIIPPSISFILYAVLAEVSIAKLFLAGIGPGIIIGVTLMIYSYQMLRTGKYYAPKDPPRPLKQLIKDIKAGLPAVITPGLILIGMTGGIISPTEAGLGATVYTIVLSIINRELKISRLTQAIRDSVMTAAHMVILIAIASSMTYLFTFERAPMEVTSFILGITNNKYLILLLINIVALIGGCFMSSTALLLMLTPVFLPLVKAAEIDLIHFGVILSYALTIGIATPPVGIGLFIMSDVAKMPLGEVYKAIMPFLVPLIIALILITYVPSFSLFLPKLLMR